MRVTVRGTRFVVTVEKEAETRVTDLQGSVWLVNPVDQAVLQEREVALVSPRSPVIRPPTLLPTITALPTACEVARATHSETAARQSTPPVAPGAASPSGVKPEPTRVVTAAEAATLQPSQVLRLTSTLRSPTVVKATSIPTATALPNLTEFHGIIEAFPPQVLGRWRIGGREFKTTKDTRIVGKRWVGAWARVLHVAVRPSARDRLAALVVLIEIRDLLPRSTSTPKSSAWARPSATRRWSPDVVSPETRSPQPTRTATLSRTPPHVETAVPALTAGVTGAPQTTPTRFPTQTPWTTSTAASQPHPSATPTRTQVVSPRVSLTPAHTAAPASSPLAPSPFASVVRFGGFI